VYCRDPKPSRVLPENEVFACTGSPTIGPVHFSLRYCFTLIEVRNLIGAVASTLGLELQVALSILSFDTISTEHIMETRPLA